MALLLAILTGRSDLCIVGVFGAGKTRSLAVFLIALSCELDDFSAVVFTKENVAAKALADQVDESQQNGNYHEVAALAAIQQPALIVFVGDHRQTPGSLSKGRAAAATRQKLLQRPLGLRALNRRVITFHPHDQPAWWPYCGLMRVRTTTRTLPACFD